MKSTECSKEMVKLWNMLWSDENTTDLFDINSKSYMWIASEPLKNIAMVASCCGEAFPQQGQNEGMIEAEQKPC